MKGASNESLILLHFINFTALTLSEVICTLICQYFTYICYSNDTNYTEAELRREENIHTSYMISYIGLSLLYFYTAFFLLYLIVRFSNFERHQ